MINKDLKVAVLGAGAMGCLFGGLLAEKGLNVILIDVWKEHVNAINKDGLKMDGHGGDRVIKVKATSDPSSLDKIDAVIVMCKATALEPALNSIKNIIYICTRDYRVYWFKFNFLQNWIRHYVYN